MAEKQRRSLVAAMFTDVVGYTAMMQQDEELERSARQRHREALENIVSEAGIPPINVLRFATQAFASRRHFVAWVTWK